MTISVGDKLPGGTVLIMGAEGPEQVDLAKKFAGRNVVLFGLPGAFTGTCTNAHLPSFIRTKGQFDAKGVDEVICLAVNDPFVLDAWSSATGAGAAGITLVGDAGSEFVSAAGLDMTAPGAGFYKRSKRFALYAEDGVVKVINIEDSPGVCGISAGEGLLAEM
ncbi:peroxiredoxin [Celeribacter arenosi]|uniref:Glutathione-dependent peroxiredoxin n=1 Tax=Celeribacter arenosi TaxID=792649 RepID=A0ABP7JZF5_9RHOB